MSQLESAQQEEKEMTEQTDKQNIQTLVSELVSASLREAQEWYLAFEQFKQEVN